MTCSCARTDVATAPGTLGATAGGGAADTLGFTASTSTSENNLMGTPTGAQTSRRVFLSRPLATDLRLSGTAAADIAASLGAAQSNLSVLVAEYGVTTQVSTQDEGVITTQPTSTAPRTCWGVTGQDALGDNVGLGATCTAPAANTIDHACYLERHQAADDDERHHGIPRHARHP